MAWACRSSNGCAIATASSLRWRLHRVEARLSGSVFGPWWPERDVANMTAVPMAVREAKEKAMDFITVEAGDRITTITLDRPDVMNAINREMHFELQDALDAFRDDP